ncbi:hypothetical protein IF650_03710 [Cellulosimicrobium terreum]|nr:hypothetical protein [Cellulosimicrobium terreum]
MTSVPVTVPVLTTVMGLVLLLGAGGLRRGALLGPLGLATGMLVAVFGVRPLLMAQRDSFDFYGLRVTDGFVLASWIGLVALVCLYTGYGLASLARRSRLRVGPPGRAARPRPAVPDPAVPDPVVPDPALPEPPMRAALLTAVVLVGAWFVALAAFGGGISFLALMFAGRSDQVAARMSGLPALVMALPVVGALVLAVVRVQLERVRRLSAGERLAFWATIAAAVVPATALGTRRFLLPVLILALVAALAPSWNRRVRASQVALGIGALVVLATVPFVRSAGSRTPGTSLTGAMVDYYGSTGPTSVVEKFFLSYDTEMFSYVAYVAPRLGADMPWGRGRGTVVELLTAPLPAGVVSESWSNERLTSLFGGSCGEFLCPVPSLPGALYFDLAMVGVVLGMVLFGWAVRAAESGPVTGTGARLVVAMGFIAFVPNVVRGNPATQLAILAQIVVVALVVLWVLGRSGRAVGRRPRPTRATVDVGGGVS